VRFPEFIEALDRAEGTSSRLETAAILAQALGALGDGDLAFAVNFLLGQLGPPYEAPPVGIGDKNALKAIAAVAGRPEAELAQRMREVGDFGLVAQEVVSASRQATLFQGSSEFADVRRQLTEIAGASGKGAGGQRVKSLTALLSSGTPAQAKYIVRFVVGKMRIGIGEGQMLEALATMAGDRKRKGEVEAAYNRHPDMADLAVRVKAGGFEAVAGTPVTPFVPLRPMLAERLKSLPEVREKMGGRMALDYKYDGLRIQVHFAGGAVRLFSRNLEPYTDQFPDVVRQVKEAARASSFIVEGEGVIVDPDTGELRPFQEASRRRGRKYEMEAAVEQYPLSLFLFDCMFVDGKDLTGAPLVERRQALTQALDTTDRVQPSTLEVVEDDAAAEAFFLKALAQGCEGVIAKSLAPEGVYRAGARGWTWIKFKRDYSATLSDTLDLVVVGAFAGRGRRTGRFGSLLMAAYDEELDRWVSVCKLASGFDDAQLAEIDGLLKPLVVPARPARVDSGEEPDAWVEPRVVAQVRGAELTLSPVHREAWGTVDPGAGLALRFTRFERWRDDKGPVDATTAAELVSMYRRQYGRGGDAGAGA
jgi:DNA ligase-1